MHKLLLAGAMLIVLTATPAARAADIAMPVKAPALEPVYNWSGLYVGANAGYGWSDQSITLSGNAPLLTPLFAAGLLPSSLASDPRGFLGGIQAGYNYQWGRMLLGAEADIAYADINRSETVNVVFTGVNYNTTGEQKLDWLGTVRARLGFLATDRLLMYATGGFAYGHGSVSTSSVVLLAGNACAFFAGCGSGSTSDWMGGWTAGGGLEWAFADRWSAKGEYLYYDLGSLSYTYPQNSPIPGGVFSASASFRGSIVRVGLNYKLN